MKLYQIEKEFGIDEIRLLEKEEPKPRRQEVLIKMRATSINYRDLLMIRGLYSRNLSLPLIPFSDGAGEVVAIGEDVTRWRPGDRVMSTFFQNWVSGHITYAGAKSALGGDIDGVLAEYVSLHEEGLVGMPEHLSFEEGATLPCAALAAWHALNAGGFTCGDTVLTLGTGGVSIFAVQFGKAAGARIVGTSSSDEKLGRLKEMGVTEGINYKTETEWDKKVRELTGDKGVDRVIEVGGAGTLFKSLMAVRVGGHISLIGVLTGQKGEINPLPAIMKCVRIQGILVGSREMFEAMVKAVTEHKIRPVIDKMFPFSEVKEALHYMSSGAHFGKVVVVF